MGGAGLGQHVLGALIGKDFSIVYHQYLLAWLWHGVDTRVINDV